MILSALSYRRYQEVAPYLDTLLLPVGSLQAHGPHLPLAADTFIANRIAIEVDQYITGRALLLPEIAYGHALSGAFAGAVDMPADLLAQMIYHAARPFSAYGAKYVVLINGNAGNVTAASLAAERLVQEGLTVLLSNWWIDVRSAILQIAGGTCHGGEDETSLLLEIAPQTVDLEAVSDAPPAGYVRSRSQGQFERQHPEAYAGSPTQATREKGEQIITHVRERLLADILEMWKQGDAPEDGV